MDKGYATILEEWRIQQGTLQKANFAEPPLDGNGLQLDFLIYFYICIYIYVYIYIYIYYLSTWVTEACRFIQSLSNPKKIHRSAVIHSSVYAQISPVAAVTWKMKHRQRNSASMVNQIAYLLILYYFNPWGARLSQQGWWRNRQLSGSRKCLCTSTEAWSRKAKNWLHWHAWDMSCTSVKSLRFHASLYLLPAWKTNIL